MLNTKVNNLEKNIFDATTLIRINQYSIIAQINKSQTKILEMLIKKYLIQILDLVATTVLNTKVSEVENKIPNTSNLVPTTVLNTKISEVENKISNNSKYITTQEFNKVMVENFDNKLTSFNRQITSKKNKAFRSSKETKQSNNKRLFFSKVFHLALDALKLKKTKLLIS